MSKIFFTSDTHFNQQRTFDLSMRGMYFVNLEHATEVMIANWNDVVSPDDIVYHLGDFGDYSVLDRLNGHIRLLYGNYERDDKPTPTEMEKLLLDEIYESWNSNDEFQWGGELYHRLPKERLLLVHEPENFESFKIEASEDERDYYDFYLFGHIHEKQKVKRNGLNVGVDVHNFTPVDMETIEFYRNAIQNHLDYNCFDNF